MIRRVDRAVGPPESEGPTRAHTATSTAAAGVDPDGHTEVTDR